METIVVGSGVAGLTAAAALAKAGHRVEVFEQFYKPGGVTAAYEKEGFRWDLGQLIVEGFGPDEPTGIVLSKLGVSEHIRLRLEDRGYVFPDFELKKPDTYLGPRWRIEALKKIFPEESQGLDRYWKDYLRFTRLMTFARRMEQAQGLQRGYWQARLSLALVPLLGMKYWSAARLMDHYFKSDKLKLVFTSILADFFTPPSQFPGLGVFALNPEISFDKRIPRQLDNDTEQLNFYSILGGMGTLVDAFVKVIQEHGGSVFTSRAVKRILVENNHVTGIIDQNGEQIPADIVVASGGAKETFLELIDSEHLPAGFVSHVKDIPLMDSVFMLHLGVDFDPTPYVHGVCTYYYGTYDIEDAIAQARQGNYHEGRDGFVVHIPSLHSPEMAPPDCHSMTIYTICPDHLREGSWQECKEEFAVKLIGYAEQHIIGLSSHVRVAEILTPDEFRQRTHLHHHAFGGIAPILGSWRVPNLSPIQGLWFVGAQSESGGGVNSVIPVAYKTAQAILADRKKG